MGDLAVSPLHDEHKASHDTGRDLERNENAPVDRHIANLIFLLEWAVIALWSL